MAQEVVIRMDAAVWRQICRLLEIHEPRLFKEIRAKIRVG